VTRRGRHAARRRSDYSAEHRELQALLAAELQSYPADPMDADEADAVAWHLADVTVAVVMAAVERRADDREEPTD
jgi:hypothetical protein